MLYILFLGLILLPLVFWSDAPVPFELPRVWFINRWIELLVAVGLIQIVVGIKKLNLKKIDSFLLYSIFGFLLIAIISSLLGVDFLKSFLGNYYRGDGLFTLFHLAGLFLLLTLFWQEKWKNYLAASISLGAFVTSLWAVISGVRFFLLGDMSVSHWVDGAIGVSFGQPNFLAGYLLVVLPFTIYLLKISKVNWHKTLFLFAIIIQAIAIVFTKSWAGVLGIGLLAILMIFFCAKFQKKTIAVFGLIFIIFAAFIIFARVSQDKGFVAEGRERIFRKVLTASFQRPILGWGWANVDYAFESVDWPIKLQSDVYVDKAHSTILEVFAVTGVIGLIIYLGILMRVGKIIISHLKYNKSKQDYLWYEALFLVFILYIFHSQTNVVSIAEDAIFWFTLGILSQSKFKV